jgi:hypothetical protein
MRERYFTEAFEAEYYKQAKAPNILKLFPWGEETEWSILGHPIDLKNLDDERFGIYDPWTRGEYGNPSYVSRVYRQADKEELINHMKDQLLSAMNYVVPRPMGWQTAAPFVYYNLAFRGEIRVVPEGKEMDERVRSYQDPEEMREYFTKTGLRKKLYPTVYEMTLDQLKAVHFLIAVEAFENFC